MNFRVEVNLGATNLATFVQGFGEFEVSPDCALLSSVALSVLPRKLATINIQPDSDNFRIWLASSGAVDVKASPGSTNLTPNIFYEVRQGDSLVVGDLTVIINKCSEGRVSLGGLQIEPTQAFPRTVPTPEDDAEDSDLASTIQDNETVHLEEIATQVYISAKDAPTLTMEIPSQAPSQAPSQPVEEPLPKRSRVTSPEQKRLKPAKLFFSSGIVELQIPGFKRVDSWSNDVAGMVAASIKRTMNFVIAVSRGLAILDPLKLAGIKGPIDVDDRGLWLKDGDGECKWGFNLEIAIEMARKKQVLAGYTVHALSKNSITMSADDLKAIVTAAGGTYVTRLQNKNSLDDVLIIMSEGEQALATSKGVKKGYSQSLILDAALTQTLDLNRNRIEL